MIILKPGSHALRLVMLLLYTGEFPYYSLDLLGDRRTMMHAVNRMGKAHDVMDQDGQFLYHGRLISVSGKDMLKTIRLNAYFLAKLKSFRPDEYRYYMEAFDKHHFRGYTSSIERNHRMAEALFMLLQSGLCTLPERQPELQMKAIKELPFHKPAFYHSRILKVIGNNDLQKNQFTRIIGAVLYSTGCYVVYNTREAMMKWCGRGESKTLQTISEITSMNSATKNPSSALLYGKDYSVALRTVKELHLNARKSSLFAADYTKIHFLPMNQFGVKVFQLMVLPDWQNELLELMFDESQIRREVGVFQYDAKIDEHYVLSFLDCDLVKLYRFYDFVRKSKYQWMVVCFEEQADFIRGYMGADVKLRVMKLQAILDYFECKWESVI